MKVFLGGTGNESTWRTQIIPMLEIDYFDPVVEDWNEKAQKRELAEREQCEFCLYCITPLMTGVYSVAEVVDDSNKRHSSTILVLLQEDKDGRKFDEAQWKSLESVARMVERNGACVFYSLSDAAAFLNGADRVREWDKKQRYTSEKNVLTLLELLDKELAGVEVEVKRTPGSEKRFWEGAKYGYNQARSLIISLLDFEKVVIKCD